MVGKPTHKEFEQIVDKRYQLENLINMNDLRKLLEDFHKIAPFPIAVLNLKGDVLLESHWEPICTRFHRVNPKTSAICAESDIHFNAELAKGDERHILYRCANGLYDAASPIMIEGQHFGNFFIGQFLLEPPDEGLFRKQAQRYGFEEEKYLEALSRVTVISEHDLKNRLNYLCGFAEFLGTVGLKEFQRDRAQEALREREASYARAVRGTSDGLWDWNVLTNEDYLSPRWKELLGYEDHELTNRYGTFFSRVHPDDTSRVEAAIQAHLEQNVPYNIDHRLRTKSGDYRWFNVRGNTERDKQGKALLMSGAITDITSRMQAEEALRESEAKYRRVADNSPAVLYQFMMTPDGAFSFPYVSDLVMTVMGIPSEDVMKDPAKFLGMVHPDDQKMFQEGIMKSAESLETFPITFRCMKDGEVIWIEARGAPTPLADGGMLWDGFLLDVTEQKQAEDALREREEKYSSLVESTEDSIYLVDKNSEYLFMNEKHLLRLGLQPDELLGKTYGDFHSEDDAQAFSTIVEKVFQTGRPDQKEHRSLRDGGYFLRTLSPVKDPGGNTTSVTVVSKNITERVRSEKALRESEEKLARSKKMEAMGLMAGGIAHDLNNILSGIVSYPELLLMDLPEDSPLRKPIKTIQESGMRAADVVGDLLTIARGVASGKEVLNLNAVVEEYLNSAEHQKLEKIHPLSTFKTELDSELLNITGSASHVKKVLMNLIVNASEAIEGRGTVTVSTMNQPLKGYEDVRTGEYVVLTISDDGSGISPQDLDRIFEPFYTKKVMGRSGTGLGLAVVWNSMQDHDGYINVKSSEKGTIFELYFPTTREQVADERGQVSLEDYCGHGEKVLVVDDEERQREIASGILSRLGYNVETVSSGEEAIEYVKENPVNLIVLDMVMPKGINGRKTYEEIIKIRPGQKAIIASGYAKTREVRTAQRLGAGKYIKKPYTLEKVGLAVKEELEKQVTR